MQDMCSKVCAYVYLLQTVCVCMCTLLGWRLCKCTNLAGFAWVQAGSWIMAPALLAGRTHLKEQQVENAILSFLFLLRCCPISVSRSVCLPWMGDGSNPDWQELWKIWQVPLSPTTFSLPSLCVVINWREVTFKMKSRSVRKNVKPLCFLMVSTSTPSLSPHVSPFISLCLLSTSVSFPFLHCLWGSAALLSLSFLSLLSVYSCTAWVCVFCVLEY